MTQSVSDSNILVGINFILQRYHNELIIFISQIIRYQYTCAMHKYGQWLEIYNKYITILTFCTDPVSICDLDLVITMPVDVLAPTSAMPSAGAMLTTKPHMLFWLLIILNHIFWLDNIIQNSCLETVSVKIMLDASFILPYKRVRDQWAALLTWNRQKWCQYLFLCRDQIIYNIHTKQKTWPL